MDQGEVFLKAGGSLGRIEAIYAQKFTRPVAEETSRVENPTTHVGKALPLNQITLASLHGFPTALAIFAVAEDTVPLENVSISVSDRHTTWHMPAVLSI